MSAEQEVSANDGEIALEVAQSNEQSHEQSPAPPSKETPHRDSPDEEEGTTTTTDPSGANELVPPGNVERQESLIPHSATMYTDEVDDDEKSAPKGRRKSVDSPQRTRRNLLVGNANQVGDIPDIVIEPVACLRGHTHFLLQFHDGDDIVKADGERIHLQFAFALVAIGQKKYRILHLQSGTYCHMRQIKDERDQPFQTLGLQDKQDGTTSTETGLFEIVVVGQGIHHSQVVTIRWKDLFLTLSNAGHVYFGPPDSVVEKQIFELCKPVQEGSVDEAEREIEEVANLLQPVFEPVARGPIKLKRPPIVSKELFRDMQMIFMRFDTDKNGYARIEHAWPEIAQFAADRIPKLVKDVIYKTVKTLPRKMIVHIEDLMETLDFVWNEKLDQIEIEKKKEEDAKKKEVEESMETLMRKLDPVILTDHPKLKAWTKMSPIQRRLLDLKLWFQRWWWAETVNNGKWALWQKHLVVIQSNYGESIFAYFEFTRWLFTLNLMMGVVMLLVIVPHAFEFPWSSTSPGTYANIFFGGEWKTSWYHYGAYRLSYGFALQYDIGVAWVLTAGLCLILCILAVIRQVLNSDRDKGDESMDLPFARDVFSSFRFLAVREDVITLQRNSIMIRLHERLLEQLDNFVSQINWKIVLRRIIGVVLTIIIATVSAAAIFLLINFERTLIVPKAAAIHPVGERFGQFIVPAGVSMMQGMTPKIVRQIVKMELYSAEFRFQQTFFRVFLLRMFAITVTLFQTASSAESNSTEGGPCVESEIGLVLFRFVLFDMALEILFYVIIPSCLYCCRRCTGSIKFSKDDFKKFNRATVARQSKQGSPSKAAAPSVAEFEIAGDSWKDEFDIPQGLVDVMYRQAIVWSAVCFSPMIAWLATAASVLSFYIRKFYLTKYCGRPKKALGVVKQLRFFYGNMLLALVVALIPFKYFLDRNPTCGPHEGYNVLTYFDEQSNKQMPAWLRIFFNFALNGIVLLPLLFLGLIYTIHVRRNRAMFNNLSLQLKKSLIKEKEEKKLLMKDFNIRF